jgi:hypothetical protein
MQYLLEVKNNKDKFVMEMLQHFRFIKTRPLTRSNMKFLSELQESIIEVNGAKKRKVKLQSAKEMLHEL